MKGKVLDFSIQQSSGVISGDDGKRYTFVASEWKSNDINPAQGVEVDFDVDDQGNAVAIYVIQQACVDPGVALENQAKNIFHYYLDALQNYANFQGRASRPQFWYYKLVDFIIAFVLGMISVGTLGFIYSLAVLVPTLAIGARRLHDTGKSGWWQLLLLIPLVGLIILIIFWAQPSQQGKNKYDVA